MKDSMFAEMDVYRRRLPAHLSFPAWSLSGVFERSVRLLRRGELCLDTVLRPVPLGQQRTQDPQGSIAD